MNITRHRPEKPVETKADQGEAGTPMMQTPEHRIWGTPVLPSCLSRVRVIFQLA
eukprot:CAMPEP_0184398540 /NCGR_PEP_ID=MMETSP0007-20130409/66106_1 /TAXON_ID=97485 /ORGANISM="Prymnesium parvum, Strain Texoma1" /LENGTH=53 /DNA_ID=CAMNT_0026752511 /DNA_START=136 /DNA_END=293 /DNA_ORIENTATION=+